MIKYCPSLFFFALQNYSTFSFSTNILFHFVQIFCCAMCIYLYSLLQLQGKLLVKFQEEKLCSIWHVAFYAHIHTTFSSFSNSSSFPFLKFWKWYLWMVKYFERPQLRHSFKKFHFKIVWPIQLARKPGQEQINRDTKGRKTGKTVHFFRAEKFFKSLARVH